MSDDLLQLVLWAALFLLVALYFMWYAPKR